MTAPWSEDLTAYAELAAELAVSSGRRDEILARHGLDEAAWEAIEDGWLARLAEAEDAFGDAEGIPPLVANFAEALAAAQAARSTELVSFERWLEATQCLAHGEDRATALSRAGITLEQFLKAQKHWTQKLIEDPELARRFLERMR